MKTFQELDLIAPLQRALADENYEIPTPIQAQTIPAALDQRDVLGCAQTGTGKTAAFALPILNRLGAEPRKTQPGRPMVLVLAPTRELAIQIGDSFATYGKHLKLRHALVYGGVGQHKQVRDMQRGVHVLVATPGRLLDLMNQGHIQLDRLEVFVLDEADRMLDMGFLPDLKRIISKLPTRRQSLFFSATMPPKIVELTQRLLRDPVSVNVTPKTTSVERIEQRVIHAERSDKQSMLRKILSGDDVDRAIVFTRTKRGANTLAEKLVKSGIPSAAIHGNKSQGARQRALDAFRRRQVQVLVATDVAARGIDIDGVTHVVNFDLPTEPESYVHRIGRTGRAGAEGLAISFCTAAERGELHAIEKLIGQKLEVSGEQPKPVSAAERHEMRTNSRRPGGSRRSGGARSGAPASGQPRSAKPRSNKRPAAAGQASGQQTGAAAVIAAAKSAAKPKAKKKRVRPASMWAEVV
ncbi:ATP-dependent RNA helicase RhlE [Rosistilla ulvae]|uniref:DEAD-box ATP-dependent RNA helicase RhpA n=1 Tax=Rosistilla ulvae TaxID=1930277 RepID=A0A517LYF7_9BACT|nr:DEAD/DEAH box helicase [Rosistilla ulvae]QDS87657.1 ATP-dependent RNA helicase RhlE [Rosistilla ulvae]